MKIKSIIYIILGITLLTSCGSNNSSQNKPYDTPYGNSVGLVQLWTVDSSGAEAGTNPFQLYESNGEYYVRFLGKYYRLYRTRAFYAGQAILTHEFTSVEGYHYYLEDVTNEDTWFFRVL